MENKHLNTIPKTQSDEKNESSVEDLNLTPSESEDLSDIETDFDHEEGIRLVKKLLYDNLSPRPSKEFNSENSDVVIESFSPSPILVEGSDSLIEEIDIFLAPDDSIPPGDVLFLEELLNDDSISFPENKSFHFDHYLDPSYSRPPAKLPDDDGIYFDDEPVTGILTVKVVDDIFERYVHMPNVLPTLSTRYPMIDTLLLFSSENKDKVFNLSILASKEEKSPHLLSHRGFKPLKLISKSPVMIYGGNVPILEVPFLYFYPP
nr:hypothetical protein [Tanacetum cinerariifolium]